MFKIRNAKVSDAQHILQIYDYYVQNTAITFEYVTPTIEDFKNRMFKTMQNYPYLVALENNNIVGYAYADVFGERAAYKHSSEVTIYIDKNHQKCGIGKMLYSKLESVLKEMNIYNLYACVAYPQKDDKYLTTNSADFHEHVGFKKVGNFYKCGYKFGQWYNMIWLEKIIAIHNDNPTSFIPYPALENQ